jgi:serine/threonine kinase 32
MLGGDLRCTFLTISFHSPASYLAQPVILVHLERKGTLPEEVVKFWVAELASGLEYLHRQRIIHRFDFRLLIHSEFIPNSILHRDIKPDNVLLDSAGHAHLTDFNVAIHYSERRMHTSVAGSMAYMAPEIIGKQGYTWCVDWWSLGVTAYELLFHKRPFDKRTADRMRHAILKDPINFPEDAASKVSPACIQVLQGVCGIFASPLVGNRILTFPFDSF